MDGAVEFHSSQCFAIAKEGFNSTGVSAILIQFTLE
jgi:hypothetical protein